MSEKEVITVLRNAGIEVLRDKQSQLLDLIKNRPDLNYFRSAVLSGGSLTAVAKTAEDNNASVGAGVRNGADAVFESCAGTSRVDPGVDLQALSQCV